MTRIVDTHAAEPCVHVLAIGVGTYRHLPGGAEPRPYDTFVRNQLQSPPRSAIAFADWTQQVLHAPVPLGSVDLLVSPVPDGLDVEEPSTEKVKAAWDRWRLSAAEHDDNISVFYFSGHGLQKTAQYLLLEDFAASKDRRFEHAINISESYAGAIQQQPRSQYFFVDACRDWTEQMKNLVSDHQGSLVLKDRELLRDHAKHKGMLSATDFGASAYADPDGLSLYTDALLRALGGLGAQPYGDGWAVTYNTLMGAVTTLLSDTIQTPGSVGTGTEPLHQLDAEPMVPFTMVCEPSHASDRAAMALVSCQTPERAFARPVAPGTWLLDVPADKYHPSIEFPENEFTLTAPLPEVFCWPPAGANIIARVL